MPSIFDALTKEHSEHRQLLDQVEQTTGDSEERRKLFSELVVELRSHANAEERTLYATMIADAETQPKASHSIHEHQVMDELIEELLETDLSSAGWLVTYRKLADETRHHMEEEENDVFVKGRKWIDGAKAEQLGARFGDEKASEVREIREKLTLEK